MNRWTFLRIIEGVNELFKIAKDQSGLNTEILDRLRRALLLSDRQESRKKGQRKLLALVATADPVIGPIARGGLAASYWWSGNMFEAISECQAISELYPFSPVSIWCSTLMISMYRSLGMKREVFEAESHKMKLMKRMIMQSDHPVDRIYALHELKKDLESRDAFEESEHFSRELRDLVSKELAKYDQPALFNEDLN